MNTSSIEDIIIKSLEETAKLVLEDECTSKIIIPPYTSAGKKKA